MLNVTEFNPITYLNGTMFFEGGTLYTTVVSKNVRTAFTLAFSVLAALIGLIGALYIRRRNQRLLLRNEFRTIPLNHLSSWMTVTELLRYFYKTRKLPAGGYGLLMLAVGAFELTSHVFVSQYINTSSRQTSCIFDRGIRDVGITLPLVPQSSLAPATIALNTQIYNILNGGNLGIYNPAVNTETFSVSQSSPNFVGTWVCEDVNDPQTYSQALNYTVIANDLESRGNLFETRNEYDFGFTGNSSTDGIFAWSASVDSDTQEPWDVKAAFSTSVVQGGTLTMTSYLCTVAAPAARSTLSYMTSGGTLDEWLETAFGFITTDYVEGAPGSLDVPPAMIALTLNAATMVAATGNKLRSPSDDVQTYGCILPFTAVNGEVIVAIFVVFLIFLFFVLGEIWLVCVTAWKRKMPLVEDVPGDLASWQTAMVNNFFPEDAVDDGSGIRKIQSRQMVNYLFGWVRRADGQDRVGFRKTGSDEVVSYFRVY